MTDVAVSLAASTFDVNAERKKPEKPDEELFKANVNRAQKECAEAVAKFEAAKANLDAAKSINSRDSPVAKKRQELINQRAEIRQKLAGGRAGRNQVWDQIKKLDDQLKSRIAEQNAARSRVPFKNADEINREIDRLDKQVNTGVMKLVDEKKALAEISNLRKLRKGFAVFDETQKGIDETKAKIKQLRDSLDNPEAKALNAKCDEIQAELNAIQAEHDEAQKNITTLREQFEKTLAEKDEKYRALKKIREDYNNQKKAWQNYEFEARQRVKERQKAERENYERAKRKERAERMLADARDPAYMDEIRRAENLLHYLDPSTIPAAAPLVAPSGLSAAPQRIVDAADIKGIRVLRKDERDDSYFMGTGGKKAKKGRKNAVESPGSSSSGKFQLPPSVMEDCSAMGIDPPMSAADNPAVTEKVREKLAFWKTDQKAQTEKNIARALKEIERLEAESTNSSIATSTTNGHAKKGASAVGETDGASEDVVEAEADKAQNATSDIVADLKSATIEDKE